MERTSAVGHCTAAQAAARVDTDPAAQKPRHTIRLGFTSPEPTCYRLLAFFVFWQYLVQQHLDVVTVFLGSNAVAIKNVYCIMLSQKLWEVFKIFGHRLCLEKSVAIAQETGTQQNGEQK